MKNLLILGLLLIPFISVAQITIDDGDMPNTNEVYPQHTALVNGLDYMLTGPTHTWDFSSLTSLTQAGEEFVPITSVGFTYMAVFGLPFDPNAANLVKPLLESPIDLGIPIDDGYEFFSNKSGAYKMVGYGLEFSGLPIPVKYSNADVIYEFPLNYEDSTYNFADMDFSFPNFFYFGRETDRTTVADGWGTLYLPNDTFDVLRLKVEITNSDTIYMDSLSFGFNLPPVTTVEYVWLAKNGGLPVLRVVDNGLTATAYYRAELDTTNLEIPVIKELDEFVVFPNPGSEFNVQFHMAESGLVNIGCYDLQGKLIEQVASGSFDAGLQLVNYKPTLLSQGTYVLKLEINSVADSRIIQYR